MTQADKQEIISYLSGPRNYAKGVALYERHGFNRMFKRRFMLEETGCTRSMLAEELRKLAGLSEDEFRRLPRRTARPSVPMKRTDSVPEPEKSPVPAEAMKTIRLRERFPFLQEPSCPDLLKIIVADMLTAHESYLRAFGQLQELNPEDSAAGFRLASEVVESYLTDREAWAELEHYQNTGKILGRAKRFLEMTEAEDLEALSDIDLIRKFNSAKANQSKRKKELKQAQEAGSDTTAAARALDRWTATRARIEAEIDARKKK